MHKLLLLAAELSDSDLLRHVMRLAAREREATVELVGHLAELDTRRLHVAEGYGSLFAYCTGALHLAEHAAYNRIEAARLARRFPAVLDLLADGSLNLSTARLLAPHLRPDNFDGLVAQARGRSKREVEALVAGIAPQPDVAGTVRRLPTPSQPVSPQPVSTCHVSGASPATQGPASVSATALSHPDNVPSAVTLATLATTAVARPTPSFTVDPLAPDRYRVQFTIDGTTRGKLRQAQDLLRREIPSGDPAAIFSRALDLLLEDVARKKLAIVAKPRPQPSAGGRERHIPASVKRAVWVRDSGRCAFVTIRGRRCPERTFLEFHHREPYGVGGEATVSNISLRCRAHNQYEGELAFGRRPNSPRGEFGTAALPDLAHAQDSNRAAVARGPSPELAGINREVAPPPNT